MLRKILSVFLKYPHDIGDVQFSLLDRPAAAPKKCPRSRSAALRGDRLLRRGVVVENCPYGSQTAVLG